MDGDCIAEMDGLTAFATNKIITIATLFWYTCEPRIKFEWLEMSHDVGVFSDNEGVRGIVIITDLFAILRPVV